MKMKLLLAVSASTLAISSPVAFADPNPFTLQIQCPNVNNPVNILSNYGDYIAGYGIEQIQGHEEVAQIYFKSKSNIKGIPAQLDDYINSGVKYNSTTGDVTCAYSSAVGDPSFGVTYTLANGKGGKAAIAESDRITVIIPFGL